MLEFFKRLITRDAPLGNSPSGLSVQQLRQISYGPAVASGVQVNEDRALSLSGVYCAVNLLSNVIASLDLRAYHRANRGKQLLTGHKVSELLLDPSQYLTDFRFRRALVMAAVTSGNGYAEIERSVSGDPLNLHLLNWRLVEPKQRGDGSIYYHLKNSDRIIESDDMIHITALSWDGIKGISPISVCRETVGIGIATERWAASIYGNGAMPSGLLKSPNAVSPEAAKNLRDSWHALYGGPDNAHKVAVLEEGLDWVQTSFSPQDAQLLACRTFSINEIARIFGVPVNLLHEATQGSYNSNEEANTQWYQTSVRAWLENIESEYDKKLFTRAERRAGYFVEHRFESLLRGNTQTRAAYFNTLFNIGAITENEIREEEGLNPVEGGDKLYVPVNLRAIDEPAPTPAPTPEPTPATDTGLVDAVREVVKDVAGRVVRRELATFKKQQPRGFTAEWLEEHLEEHKTFLHEALRPALNAWHHANNTQADLEETVNRWSENLRGLVTQEGFDDEAGITSNLVELMTT